MSLKPHGTYAGWNRHVKSRETPCEPCAEAQREYQRERRRRHGSGFDYRAKSVTVPNTLFAELYLNAPIELQDRVDKEIGATRINRCVRLFDAQENAS